MKKIAVILTALALSAGVLWSCTENTQQNEVPGEINNSTENSEDTNTEVVPGYKELYLETVNELNSRYEDVEWSYGLVDINGDEAPELVAGYPVCISLYTYSQGKVYTLMEEQTYGFAGNNGYLYQPGKNVIFSSDYDMAGAVVYENYLKIGENNELDNYHNKPLYSTVWKDANGDGVPDDNEIGDTTYYYYGNDELSEEAYNNLRFGDGFEGLYGEMTYDEIVAELTK